jgi:type IV pilus assembly protein PilB
MKGERLGEILVEHRAIRPVDLELALAVQAAAPVSAGRERLGEVLLRYNLLSGEGLARALGEQVGWPYFNGEYILEAAAGARIKGLMREGAVFPSQVEGEPVFILRDPYDTRTTDTIEMCFGREARFAVGAQEDIAKALRKSLPDEEGLPAVSARQDLAAEVELVMARAVQAGATDVHIEPADRTVEVRFRIDGELRFHCAFPGDCLSRIINIFFHQASVSPGDFIRLHDARFEYSFRGRLFDVRLSHIPSVQGSSLVLRLMDKSRSVLTLEALGYSPRQWQLIQKAVQLPHGMVLFTGPTGCGKTTSLYAVLNHLKDVSRKIVTVEDPVEIMLPLAVQAGVDPKKGHDFPTLTRAFLRHDPDIMLIGEIRDEKTAREAVRAAITGHKVFSTLHTGDIAGAVLRLIDLGVDKSFVAHALTCVIAQRLVRKLCPFCREAALPPEGGWSASTCALIQCPDHRVFRARGCGRCSGGFAGRTVVCETMAVDDEVRSLIEQGRVHEIKRCLETKPGHVTLREDAARLVSDGVLCVDEAVRRFG